MDKMLADKLNYISELGHVIERQLRLEEDKRGKDMNPSPHMIERMNSAISHLETIYFSLRTESIVWDDIEKQQAKDEGAYKDMVHNGYIQ